MARGRRKTKAFKQGSLAYIYKYFISPLIRHKPQGTNLHDWMDAIFCADERIITRNIVTKKFKMPGAYWMSSSKLVTGYGNREIKVGYKVWVRKDTTMPDRIDVEVRSGQGLKHGIFALTRREFDSIKGKLEEVRFRRYKKAKFSWEGK